MEYNKTLDLSVKTGKIGFKLERLENTVKDK